MKYEFYLADYDDIMSELHERPDINGRGIAEVKIAEEEGSELYAKCLRIYVPELNISVREGTEWNVCKVHGVDGEEREEPMDSVIVYLGDETDIFKYDVSWCNCSLEGIVSMIAHQKKLNDNPLCYIDDSELVYDFYLDSNADVKLSKP